jgi:hypothetical protein
MITADIRHVICIRAVHGIQSVHEVVRPARGEAAPVDERMVARGAAEVLANFTFQGRAAARSIAHRERRCRIGQPVIDPSPP